MESAVATRAGEKSAASNSGAVVNRAPPVPRLMAVIRDHGEDHQEDQLGRQEQPVDQRGERDPDVVDHRVHGQEHHDPDPLGQVGENPGHRLGREHAEQGRDQQVVQQDRPAGQEADVLVEPAPDVGVDGAGHREGLRHLRVGDRGEDHRDQADQVDQRRHALGLVVHRSEDRPWGDRHHEDQAVDDQVRGGQRPPELLAVAELGELALRGVELDRPGPRGLGYRAHLRSEPVRQAFGKIARAGCVVCRVRIGRTGVPSGWTRPDSVRGWP
jgi:hypothetical protein